MAGWQARRHDAIAFRFDPGNPSQHLRLGSDRMANSTGSLARISPALLRLGIDQREHRLSGAK